jgi:hypothetical protein
MPRFFLAVGLAVGLAAAAAPAAAPQAALGVFGSWGAFRSPGRCYAIAEADGAGRRDGRPFAAISWWPDRGVRGQVHFRLERPKRPGSAVLLRIDERTFQLIGGRSDAWAPDPRADADIVTAMRTGLLMTVETRSETGALLRNAYPLRGAASAIDAAAIGCAGR